MEWSADGLIIGIRRHGETSLIVEAMVEGRGRCLGLVRGGRSQKQAPFLQPGNSAQLTWRARLEDHLGLFSVEPARLRAANFLSDRRGLYLCQLLCEYLHLLPERDPHDDLLEDVVTLLDAEVTDAELGKDLARFELYLLEELGFGLDLDSCASTGVHDDLVFVSPKSGRAVSRAAGAPFEDRLLRLPQFLRGDVVPNPGDIADAFRLTGHFLARHIWHARQIEPPSTRDWLVDRLSG